LDFDLTILEELSEIAVFDENGTSIQLGSIWREKRSALVFVRHFG
jgi:hypothetical protein